jgi:hypothetical protein
LPQKVLRIFHPSKSPLSTPTLYIFIHKNRANPITKCPQNPTIYSRFPPFAHYFVAFPHIAHSDSLKSAPVAHSIPYSNFLLFFDLLWNKSKNSTKLIQNAYPTGPNAHLWIILSHLGLLLVHHELLKCLFYYHGFLLYLCLLL